MVGRPDWERLELWQAKQTATTKAALRDDLRALSLTSLDELLDSFEWARLAQGVAYVREEMKTGLVRRPAGLFIWWLKRKTGRPVFR